jgi:preprotein translocase subunit SecD
MNVRPKALAAALGLLGCVHWAAEAGQPGEKAVVKFEVRRAETRPAKGLTEAVVQGTGQKVYLHKDVALSNKDVARARIKQEPGQAPAVEVTFTDQGAERVAKLTERHQGKPLAILLDGKVVATPVLRATISGGQAVITADFTRERAERIAQGMQGR